LRGLERTASPEAGQQILNWIDEQGLRVPPLPLQTALIQCCAERPQILLSHLQDAEPGTRAVLGRVLGEVATPSLGMELLRFVDDDLAELRAAAARALSHMDPANSIDVLSQLAEDSVWFVRLRAVVSLGQLSHPGAISPLLHGLGDSHRLVRFRAAEALIGFVEQRISIFQSVVAAQDRYALHAFLAALDNAGLQGAVRQEVEMCRQMEEKTRRTLLEVLRTGQPPIKRAATTQVTKLAISRP
jgi:HEAT repeat protein